MPGCPAICGARPGKCVLGQLHLYMTEVLERRREVWIGHQRHVQSLASTQQGPFAYVLDGQRIPGFGQFGVVDGHLLPDVLRLLMLPKRRQCTALLVAQLDIGADRLLPVEPLATQLDELEGLAGLALIDEAGHMGRELRGRQGYRRIGGWRRTLEQARQTLPAAVGRLHRRERASLRIIVEPPHRTIGGCHRTLGEQHRSRRQAGTADQRKNMGTYHCRTHLKRKVLDPEGMTVY